MAKGGKADYADETMTEPMPDLRMPPHQHLLRAAKPILAALRPSVWWLAILGIALGLRAAAWTLSGVWQHDLQLRGMIKGLSWDVALLLAFVMAARATQVLPGRRWWPWLPALALAVAMAVRWLDLAHCYMVRAHWTASAFLYLDEGFAGSLADPRVALALGAVAVTAVAMAWSVLGDVRAVRGRPVLPKWASVLAFVLTLPAAAWALRDATTYPADVDAPRLVPEINFALKWEEAHRRPKLAAPPRVPLETWRKFAALGLVRDDVAADAEWPLMRQHLDQRPFPHPKRPGAAADPDVVVTFMESANTLFIEPLSGRYLGLMPETSALARRMTSVDGFHNTTAPTIAALVTALCSIHPSAHPLDLAPGQTVAGSTAYTCLADLLRARGYRTVFVQGASKTVTSKEYFLRTHGFDEVWGREELAGRFQDRPQGAWGLHDAELVTFVKGRIKELEAQRAIDKRPFLLVMLTLDTHEPGMAAPDCALPAGVADVPADPKAQRLLAAYHCSDRAIGDLGRFLMDDAARRDRTVWLLTADHAMFADLVPPSVYPSEEERRQFTHVPFLLHDPLHDLPARVATLSGTRDLSPTLLHVLGVTEPTNSMTGSSIFGGRRERPFLIGRVGERLAFARTPDAAVEISVGEVNRACQDGRTLLQAGNVAFTACDMAAWLRWQDGLWQAERLFPAHLYHGADGVLDPGGLARKQELNHAEIQALHAN